MAVNTTMATNIGPIERPTSSDIAITTRPGVVQSAPFQPETQVDIENSIKSMLALLSKVEIGNGAPVQKMPEELQKLVNELLKNSFSVDASLAQGLNTMLQTQRFTVEQLTILAKFVEQLSVMVDAKENGNLSESMKIILANLISLDGNGGKNLDSVNLTKLAFQLLEGKPLADLPEALQFLLLQNPGNLNLPPQQTNEMNFLKQLIQFFLPQASEGDGAPVQGQASNQTMNPQTGQNQNAQGTSQGQAGANQTTNSPQLPNSGVLTQPSFAMQEGQSQPPSNQTVLGQTTPGQSQNPTGASAQPGTTDSAQSNSNQQATQNQQTTQSQQGQPGRQDVPQAGAPLQQNAGNNPSTMQGPNTTPQPGSNPQGNSLPGIPNRPAAANPSAPGTGSHSALTEETSSGHTPSTGQTGMGSAGSPAMKNTPEMLQLMKNMAGQLMNKASLTSNEFNVLRNFVNQQREILDDQEVKQLQTLLRMSEQNMPVAIRQAAARQNLSELPKLWAFVQLCNLSRLLDLPANRLRHASKNVNDFATMLKKSAQIENGAVGNQRSISFMTPLYLGENDHCYPAYIHLYHESENESGVPDGEEKRETWLRLCLMTEHIGAVELIFRLYEQENINLRLSFSNEEVAESFQSYIPELESAFESLPLNLTDIKVLAIGG